MVKKYKIRPADNNAVNTVQMRLGCLGCGAKISIDDLSAFDGFCGQCNQTRPVVSDTAERDAALRCLTELVEALSTAHWDYELPEKVRTALAKAKDRLDRSTTLETPQTKTDKGE